MREWYFGFYATRLYLPWSSLSRRFRRFSRRVRGKRDRFLQDARLPQVSWRECTEPRRVRVWEHGKQNGNVRISELGILANLAQNCPDGTTLFEIGTFDGRTSLNLAMSAPRGCQIYTLDLPPDVATKFSIAEGEQHMVDKPRSGVRCDKYRAEFPETIGRIHQLYGDSATFDYRPYHNSCSLVFVDGSHAYDYAMSDTRAAMELVAPGGVIIWHDYGIWEGVNRALEELEAEQNLGLKNIRGTSLVYWRRKA